MRPILAALVVVLAGCAVSASTPIQRPFADGSVAANRVTIPNAVGDEAVLGLPAGALASQASLLRFGQVDACFDVVLRTWQGAAPEWALSLRADGDEVARDQWRMPSCNGGSCLPPDSYAEASAFDGDPRVQVRGGRVCVEGHSVDPTRVAELELVLSQGAYSLQFEWRLSEGPLVVARR